MSDSDIRITRLSLVISLFYPLISFALIIPIYYQYSLINPGYMNFYSAMSSDLPVITQLMLRAYDESYLFSVLVVTFAALFYIKHKKSGSSTILFVLLNAALLLCLTWREFAMLALQLPAFEVMKISGVGIDKFYLFKD